jgi:hypothetical protein
MVSWLAPHILCDVLCNYRDGLGVMSWFVVCSTTKRKKDASIISENVNWSFHVNECLISPVILCSSKTGGTFSEVIFGNRNLQTVLK